MQKWTHGIEKVNRGRQISGQMVLDIGAGAIVDSRATHAVDMQATFWLGGGPPPSGVDYYPRDVNLEKEPLPYPSNMFDLVVSYGALGWNFSNDFSFAEARRVLKPSGTIELGVNLENVKETRQYLERTGFDSIETRQMGETTIFMAYKSRPRELLAEHEEAITQLFLLLDDAIIQGSWEVAKEARALLDRIGTKTLTEVTDLAKAINQKSWEAVKRARDRLEELM